MEDIRQILKQARIVKVLKQRTLTQMVGLPLGHLSKIERGQVDLQTSNLIELARALELELMLVPRILVQTVEKLHRGLSNKGQTRRVRRAALCTSCMMTKMKSKL